MLRKITAFTLAIAFIAMATSGLMMRVIEKPLFTIQMHPVHKLFGLSLIVSAVTHVTLNFGALKAHLKHRSVALSGSILVVALVVLYGVAINNKVPGALAVTMDQAAALAEQRESTGAITVVGFCQL